MRRPSPLSVPASAARPTVPRAEKSKCARPDTTAALPIHGCSSCSDGMSPVTEKSSGASRGRASGRRARDRADGELGIGRVAPRRAQRRGRVEASSVNRATASSAVMPAAIVASEVALRAKKTSPPSRRIASLPVRRGAAASDHSPPSVTVEPNGSGAPASRATDASGTPVKLPEVVILPSSHANSARRMLPSATASRVAPMRTRARASCTVAGAASCTAKAPAIFQRLERSVPRCRRHVGGLARQCRARRGPTRQVEVLALHRERQGMLRQRSGQRPRASCRTSRPA